MRDKEVFRFDNLDCDKLALSLGLATAPAITFVKKSALKNVQRNADDDGGDDKEVPAVKKLSGL